MLNGFTLLDIEVLNDIFKLFVVVALSTPHIFLKIDSRLFRTKNTHLSRKLSGMAKIVTFGLTDNYRC